MLTDYMLAIASIKAINVCYTVQIDYFVNFEKHFLECVGVGEFVFVLIVCVVEVSGRERIKLDPAAIPKEAQRLR